ncbi:sulfite exporter TauE/SafE family protein [Vibrio sp. SS-MA-C1-2]|uniref:sulfite exporter TauE/SafE family protein n=1 Tax=Vibrio sp. SS-MA-C1-2 TaxID=2908646 RepID=UPI001F2C2E55|nr:sulfite exporter TauE/SafE family protein [Vibrio sp. SS-MA-C1-2]UJF18319.1 sulfite exporter TauE/SafE family protein [Vibrio sp. SS-MA-C1-2]
MYSEIAILALISFTTSAFNAIAGAGGGMVMMGALPIWLPSNAVVPIHGLVQLFSNGSRAYFLRKNIDYASLKTFVIGCLLGSILGGLLLQDFPTEWLPLIIGIYILLNTWVKPFIKALARFEHPVVLGAIQGAFGLFVGAPGPLIISAMKKRYCNDYAKLVATIAVFNSISHFSKLVIYIVIGFSFEAYWQIGLVMIGAAIIGSLVGKMLQSKIPTRYLQWLLTSLLTLLAINMIINVLKIQL